MLEFYNVRVTIQLFDDSELPILVALVLLLLLHSDHFPSLGKGAHVDLGEGATSHESLLGEGPVLFFLVG